MPLTSKQQKTLDELRNNNYDKIKMNEISSTLNGAFNKDEPAEVKKEIIKGGVEWFIQNPKSKVKDKSAINKILISKIKKLASSSSEKTTKEMRAEERELFNNVKDKIKGDSEEEEEEEEKKEEKEGKAPVAPVAPTIVAPAQLAPAQPDYEMMKMMADATADQRAEEINEEGESYLDTLSQYIDTGSQFYKDNKKTINKALGALKPQKIQDGSYLTELASLAYPEIEVFQKVIKEVGLGFSKDDSEKFAKMLSRDKDVQEEVSYDDTVKLVMKMMINPDQVGVLIQTKAGQAADDAKAWWKKIKGEDRDLTPKEAEVKEKIDRRRKEIENKKNREKGIDEWFGIEEEKKEPEEPVPYSPFKPIHKGGGYITGGGVVVDTLPTGIDPVDVMNPPGPDYDDMSSYDILIPPGDEFGQTTGGKDFMDTLRSIVSMGGIKIPNKDQDKAQYLAQLKREHPEKYEQYQNALAKYNKTIGKARLERDGFVNYELSKDYVDSAKNLSQDLIKKAIERGDISREAAGKLYDVWDLFNGVASGDEKMTYAQMEKLQQQLYRALPNDLIKENSDDINKFMTDNIDFLQPGWEGDSDLGNFDWLNNILTGEDVDPDDVDLKVKEKKIDPKKQKPQAEPKYRYRGKWGDTDTLFKREDEEIEKRNLILEIGHLREQLDTTNQLIQAQMSTERRRFDRTFEMPYCPPVKSRALPEAFKREHRAIFTPQYVNPMREPDRNFFMNPTNDYGQYKEWSDRVPESSARSYLIKDPLVYPSNADIATGGEAPPIAPAKDYNYILNQRFIR